MFFNRNRRDSDQNIIIGKQTIFEVNESKVLPDSSDCQTLLYRNSGRLFHLYICICDSDIDVSMIVFKIHSFTLGS